MEPIWHFLGQDSSKCVGNCPFLYFYCPVLRDVLAVTCVDLIRLKVINVKCDYAE